MEKLKFNGFGEEKHKCPFVAGCTCSEPVCSNACWCHPDYDAEDLSNKSPDYQRGHMAGFNMGYNRAKENLFDELAEAEEDIYSEGYDDGYAVAMQNMGIDEDEDLGEPCECYEEGFDRGFRLGYQSAMEEAEPAIYIDTAKICKLDQLHHELIDLGKRLHPTDIDKLNAVLRRVLNLKYDVAKEAVDEYLGYR